MRAGVSVAGATHALSHRTWVPGWGGGSCKRGELDPGGADSHSLPPAATPRAEVSVEDAGRGVPRAGARSSLEAAALRVRPAVTPQAGAGLAELRRGAPGTDGPGRADPGESRESRGLSWGTGKARRSL